MFEIRPQFYRKSENLIVIRLSRWFRAPFAAVAALLLWGMIGSGSDPLALILVAAISVAAGLYNDRWILDRDRRVAEYHLGVLFLFRRKVMPFDAIDHLEHREFTRSRLRSHRAHRFERPSADESSNADEAQRWKAQRAVSRISVVMQDGRRYGMELVSYEPEGMPGTTAAEVAEFMGVDLVRLS
jgi:hypothetical protein